MKLLSLIVLALLYGVLFHGATRLCTALFGPFPVESGVVVPVRDLACLAVSSLSAAGIATAAWRWRYNSFALRDAFAVGSISIALIVSNVLAARGPDGLVELFATRPVHATASFLVAFLAVPICAWIASRRRRVSRGLVSRARPTPSTHRRRSQRRASSPRRRRGSCAGSS